MFGTWAVHLVALRPTYTMLVDPPFQFWNFSAPSQIFMLYYLIEALGDIVEVTYRAEF